ncbi:hypothetical protein D4S03_04700 [bacterium]|nr:MAG: hypothetical protein D4S03_04700 [bacterium]
MGAPYAFSLVPGADVIGDLDTGWSVLYVNNEGAGNGVFALSAGTGFDGTALHALSTDPGGIALWAENESNTSTDVALVVSNDGTGPLIKGFGGDGGEDEFRVNNDGSIWSEADTEINVSPLKMVAGYDSNVTLRAHDNGYMEVRPNIAVVQVVYVPVDLPSVLFGTATKLKSVRVCYSVDQVASYITATSVDYIGDSGGYTTLITDSIDRKSTVWECYKATDATPNAIQGSLSVRFSLQFAGIGSSHDIQIGRITLTLTEQ